MDVMVIQLKMPNVKTMRIVQFGLHGLIGVAVQLLAAKETAFVRESAHKKDCVLGIHRKKNCASKERVHTSHNGQPGVSARHRAVLDHKHAQDVV